VTLCNVLFFPAALGIPENVSDSMLMLLTPGQLKLVNPSPAVLALLQPMEEELQSLLKEKNMTILDLFKAAAIPSVKKC
jgi:hypothetical protein